MRAAMTQLNLSARAYHRILKLARTIADLAGSEEIQSPHLAEAFQFCPKIIMGNLPPPCPNPYTPVVTFP
jgi:magnesium chelatase family protein